jgi:hypothetical protein
MMSENLRQLPNGPVFVFETSDRFADIATDAFVTRIPGGSVVICVCGDRNKIVVLDRRGYVEKVY